MIKRFLTVAAAGLLLAGSAWLSAGSAMAAPDLPVEDDPNGPCAVCW